jgi:hypothetical protein
MPVWSGIDTLLRYETSSWSEGSDVHPTVSLLGRGRVLGKALAIVVVFRAVGVAVVVTSVADTKASA